MTLSDRSPKPVLSELPCQTVPSSSTMKLCRIRPVPFVKQLLVRRIGRWTALAEVRHDARRRRFTVLVSDVAARDVAFCYWCYVRRGRWANAIGTHLSRRQP
jgi:hypothetical protein